MKEKELSSDAYKWMYRRYIKNEPDAQAFLRDVKTQADLAGQIYSIRNKLRMTRDDLAECSGLTPETIEDIEESDYDGDWDEAIARINRAFHHWFTEVIVPAAQMKPNEYSVKPAIA